MNVDGDVSPNVVDKVPYPGMPLATFFDGSLGCRRIKSTTATRGQLAADEGALGRGPRLEGLGSLCVSTRSGTRAPLATPLISVREIKLVCCEPSCLQLCWQARHELSALR